MELNASQDDTKSNQLIGLQKHLFPILKVAEILTIQVPCHYLRHWDQNNSWEEKLPEFASSGAVCIGWTPEVAPPLRSGADPRVDCFVGTPSQRDYCLPHLPLLAPTRRGRDGPKVPLRDCVPTTLEGRQEQNLPLQVRREAQQIHNLRQPRPRHVAQPRLFRLVVHHAIADQLVETDRQGHEPRHAGQTPERDRWRGVTVPKLFPCAPSLSEMQLALNGDQAASSVVLANSPARVFVPVGRNVSDRCDSSIDSGGVANVPAKRHRPAHVTLMASQPGWWKSKIMTELAGGYLHEDNISSRLPETEMEAAALRLSIADLLQSIPATWAQFDFDRLTKVQSDALFLLTAAGMVERRGWMRIMFANHPTCFEVRFQATGEGGFGKAIEHATVVEYHTWGDAWRKWCDGETKNHSPFHVQPMQAQEWRLTEHGEFARNELNPANPAADPTAVFDFVLKRGFFGPGFWLRRSMARGRPLTDDERGILEHLLAAGHDLTQLSRPFFGGSGQLLEIRKIEQTAASQAVNVTNWGEGASAFADSFGKLLGPMFEAMEKAPPSPDATTEGDDGQPSTSPSPTRDLPAESPMQFSGGEMVFLPDMVTFCGIDICSGRRLKIRRQLLELLSRRNKVNYVAYDAETIAKNIVLKSGADSVAGLIRGLRDDITKSLREVSNIECGRLDVVLSGGPGYRFSESVSVQFAPRSAITDITDKDHGHNVPDGSFPKDRDRDAERRKGWILQQLATGRPLKAPDVAEHFACSVKTAQRDFTVLKDEGKIEFVGTPRTGCYRVRPTPEGE